MPKQKITHSVYHSATGEDDYIAETKDGGKAIYISAHCLQCAKVELLCMVEGSRVDIRGWHHNTCGAFLKAVSLGGNENG